MSMGHPISLPSKEVKSTEHIGKAESERSHFNADLQDPRDMAKAELLEI